MDVTAESLNSPRSKQLQKARQDHIDRVLRRLQTKIQMANTIGQQECWYDVESSMHMNTKQTAKAIILELQKRGFHIKPYVDDERVTIHVSWFKKKK